MNGECCMVRELLPLYLEDLTTPETRAQIQAHLQICTACQEEKTGWRRRCRLGSRSCR